MAWIKSIKNAILPKSEDDGLKVDWVTGAFRVDFDHPLRRQSMLDTLNSRWALRIEDAINRGRYDLAGARTLDPVHN